MQGALVFSGSFWKAAPAYLSVQHLTEVQRLLASAQSRLKELDEVERSARITAWQRRYLDLTDVERLDRHTTEQLLQGLRNPPCELRPEEQMRLAPIADRLTAHLDQLSLDELLARIERLSAAQQRQLLVRLSSLLSGQPARAAGR